MSMRAPTVLLALLGLLVLSVLIGLRRSVSSRGEMPEVTVSRIPNIGSIQVLNGCGITGAAAAVAGLLRERDFDVKDIGNASTWNYPFTIVASRSVDMTVARRIARTLNTDKLVLLKSEDKMHTVCVLVGPDFTEMIR